MGKGQLPIFEFGPTVVPRFFSLGPEPLGGLSVVWREYVERDVVFAVDVGD